MQIKGNSFVFSKKIGIHTSSEIRTISLISEEEMHHLLASPMRQIIPIFPPNSPPAVGAMAGRAPPGEGCSSTVARPW